MYYGGASGSYTNSVDVGDAATGTICCLLPGTTYYFAVKAYLASGEESTFSEEVSYRMKGVANVPPQLSAIQDISVTSDAGPQVISLTGISPGTRDETQTVTISARSSRADLVPTPTIRYTSGQASGTLQFEPVANASGVATITLTLDDGQSANNLSSYTFKVTVKPPNTPPSFNPIGDTAITTDGTERDLLVTGIRAGADGEVQPLSITATSNRPDLLPDPTVLYTSPASTAKIHIAPIVNANGVVTITVTINDGQPTNNRFSDSFNVSVKPLNAPPYMDPISDLTIAEDTKSRTVVLTGIDPGAASEIQNLTFRAVSSLPSLVPHPTVTYQPPNTTATLTLAPTPDQSGVADITVIVSDGQVNFGEFTRTFRVVVYPLNDPPQLDPIADVTFEANSEARSISISGINSGATNESQRLTVTATSSVPSLLPNPIVAYTSPDSTGILTLAPVAGASGVATVSVSVSDGQSANSLTTRTFQVEILTAATNAYFLEAEDAVILPPMETAALVGASQEACVFSRIDEQGTVTFRTSIGSEGSYYVWARVLSTSSSQDSFYLTWDEAPAMVFHAASTKQTPDWEWVLLKDLGPEAGAAQGAPHLLPLTRGSHRFTFRSREAFTFLDALYLTTDPESLPPSRVPSGIQAINIPSPLQVSQLGTLQPASRVILESGQFTVKATGTLSSETDQALFINQTMLADGGVTVHLGAGTTAPTNEFRGVMIREDLGSRSIYAALGVTGANRLSWRQRSEVGQPASAMEWPLEGSRPWIHLRRVGNDLLAYASLDGFGWSLIYSSSLNLRSSVQIGLVVSSGIAPSTVTATFTDFRVSE